MAQEKINDKSKDCQCGEGCNCDQNKIMVGFKYGFGFWLAGLATWVFVSIVIAILYYFL
jgi:hypothetical protein